jgi:hypothetical protein
MKKIIWKNKKTDLAVYEAKLDYIDLWIRKKSTNKYQWMIFTGSGLSDCHWPKRKKYFTLKEAKKQSEMAAQYFLKKEKYVK